MGISSVVWLHVTTGLEHGRAVEVGDEAVTLGSGAGCTLVLTDPAVAPLVGILLLTGVLGGGGDDQPDVAGIVKAASSSTVRILAREEGQEGSGTGWVLDAKQGYVVTNFHVVNAGNDLSVSVDGAERDAKLVGAAPCDDLAVLQVGDRHGLTDQELADPG